MHRHLSLLLAFTSCATAMEPANKVREMSTDRPDTTESAFTVPPGMWQVEMETLSAEREGGDTTLTWGSTNLKRGLTDFLDIQLVTPGWQESPDSMDGWTDMEIRLKWNLSGQRPGDAWALALMPYVKVPVASRGLGNDDWEGGLIVPFARVTTGPCQLAWMLAADVLRNDADTGWTGALTLSGTAGFDITRRLSAFTEAVFTLPLDGGAQVYLNAGLIYTLRDNWTLDAGFNAGLTDAATDLRLFAGTSFRF